MNGYSMISALYTSNFIRCRLSRFRKYLQIIFTILWCSSLLWESCCFSSSSQFSSSYPMEHGESRLKNNMARIWKLSLHFFLFHFYMKIDSDVMIAMLWKLELNQSSILSSISNTNCVSFMSFSSFFSCPTQHSLATTGGSCFAILSDFPRLMTFNKIKWKCCSLYTMSYIFIFQFHLLIVSVWKRNQ